MRSPREPLYRVWFGMVQRCLNTQSPDYAYYGGRGIVLDPRWREFAAFADAMRAGYRPDLTLDRIDTNGPYAPGNCRWADRREQARNRRSTRWIDCPDGQRRTLSEVAALCGVSRLTLQSRLRLGWTKYEHLTAAKLPRWNTAARLGVAKDAS